MNKNFSKGEKNLQINFLIALEAGLEYQHRNKKMAAGATSGRLNQLLISELLLLFFLGKN